MPKPDTTVHEFCAGGGCCPVLVQHPDKSLDIVEHGERLVQLRPADASKLVRILLELGYGVET